LNFPFKADLDVKSADEANDLYLGSHQEWVMGPEIQAGWWKGIDVNSAFTSADLSYGYRTWFKGAFSLLL